MAELSPLEMPCPEKSGLGVRIPLSPLAKEDVAVTWRPLLICVAVFKAISPSVLDLCLFVVPDMVIPF
jgi:hypothetical protein